MAKGLAWRVRELAFELPNNKGNDWVYDGNCYGKDVNDFVYAAINVTESRRHMLSKICEGCPVMETCRYEGVRLQEEGWWGGMDRAERVTWAAENLFKDKL